MCEICAAATGSFSDELKAMIAELGLDDQFSEANSPEQYSREEYRNVDFPGYTRSTYVGDYIVSTEMNPAYTELRVGLAIAMGKWEDVPSAFVTAVARIGSGSLGEYKDKNGWPTLIHEEYSRSQESSNVNMPKADELDVLHESVMEKAKNGEFDTL